MDAFRELLLVENNPEEAELTLLALKNYIPASQVAIVEDGRQALEFLFRPNRSPNPEGETLPRMILLELELPRMDGFCVLKAIRENSQTLNLPVVIVSASNDEEDIRRSYELGANDYIVKSMNFDQFREAMCSVGNHWLQITQTAE